MAICGWCKQSNLTNTHQTSQTDGAVLTPHTVPGTVSTACKGPETYKDMGEDGKSKRSKG